MIFDLRAGLGFYRNFGIAGRYAKAVNFLMNTNLENLEPGEYVIDGGNMFANVVGYTTMPWEEAKFEAHENYTNIQYVIQDSEMMSFAPVNQLNVSVPYDPKEDVVFFNNANPGLQAVVHAGEYVIFNPWDGHEPEAADDEPAPIKKVIVKIKGD